MQKLRFILAGGAATAVAALGGATALADNSAPVGGITSSSSQPGATGTQGDLAVGQVGSEEEGAANDISEAAGSVSGEADNPGLDDESGDQGDTNDAGDDQDDGDNSQGDDGSASGSGD